jgi:tetraacyldisaccharide 4'-kinase
MNHSSARLLLLPLSWVYGLIVGVRNILFNLEVLVSKSYDVPILSIGNITVGGTGKTPHTEFLIEALSKEFQVAVLSRGYKRKTKGFVLANDKSSLSDIGDEPLQMKQKFPNVIVAVDENRCRGIENLMDSTHTPYIDVILLDDAYQHRYVSPSISILLIDYNRLLSQDFLLPAGDLRESASQTKRAQIIILTKCPSNMSPMDIRVLSTKIKLETYQTLFFTTQKNSALIPLIKERTVERRSDSGECESDGIETNKQLDILTVFHKPEKLEHLHTSQIPVLLVTGIATPKKVEELLKMHSPNVKSIFFADHHEFSKRDAKKIKQEFEKIRHQGGLVVTTEKDATRIRNNPWLEELLPYIYYPSLEIQFLGGEEELFLQKIINYVKINRRHRTLS